MSSRSNPPPALALVCLVVILKYILFARESSVKLPLLRVHAVVSAAERKDGLDKQQKVGHGLGERAFQKIRHIHLISLGTTGLDICIAGNSPMSPCKSWRSTKHYVLNLAHFLLVVNF